MVYFFSVFEQLSKLIYKPPDTDAIFTELQVDLKYIFIFTVVIQTKPRFELHCSSDVIHIRTCSDSCAALMNLIQYIASYGDLHPPAKTEIKRGVSKPKMKV